MDTLDILVNLLLDTPATGTFAFLASVVVAALVLVLLALLLAQSRMEEWHALTSEQDADAGIAELETLFSH